MKTRKVLLIDDDAEDRQFFQEALEEVAPEIICITSGNCRLTIEQLNKKEFDLPDIIFLDINLPKISGWQCLSILKEHEAYKSIPVIMYSTSSHAEEVKKAMQLGAFCFFTKPSDFKDLKDALSIVARHLNNNSLPSLIDNSSSLLFLKPSIAVTALAKSLTCFGLLIMFFSQSA